MKFKSLIFYIAGIILLYGISTGVSYAAFTYINSKQQVTVVPLPLNEKGKFVIDPSLPKTEVCPLNGQKFTGLEKDIWVNRRPLAVMIENHEESRPQSGLSYADIVYEAVAEGGITRFMGVFYCGVAAYNVEFAPVRSARTYFVDWVSEYDGLYNHVGGAGKCNDDTVDERAKALCQIGKYGIKDLDQFGLKIKDKDKNGKEYYICFRNPDRLDHEVAYEHQMVCTSNGLYNVASERKWTNVDEEGVAWDENFQEWKFKDDAEESGRGTVASISFVHWSGYEAKFGVLWNWDQTTNAYKRVMGGTPHIDFDTKQQLTAKNIVVQFTKETDGVDEHAHVLYGTIGTGKALIFQDGKAISGTWKKAKRTDRTIFFDDKGKEITFDRGQIWIEVVSVDTKVTY